jgi:hypothetical protein
MRHFAHHVQTGRLRLPNSYAPGISYQNGRWCILPGRGAMTWLAAVMVLSVLAGIPLARTVAAARR